MAHPPKRNSEKFCLLGSNTGNSLSPAIHNFIFHRDGIEAVYEICDIPEGNLSGHNIVKMLEKLRGFNVTIPHKRIIYLLFENRSDIANLTGSANTVDIPHSTGSTPICHNTDVIGIRKGFLNIISELMVLPSKLILLGGGGAARSMIYAFLHEHQSIKSENDREIIVFLRNPLKGRDLEELHDSILNSHGFLKFQSTLRVFRWDDDVIAEELRYGGIIVNATPRGSITCEDSIAFDFDKYNLDGNAIIAFDMVYNPPETRFLKSADSIGARSIGGLGMLMHQALASLEIWFEREFSDEGILDSLHEAGFDWFMRNMK